MVIEYKKRLTAETVSQWYKSELLRLLEVGASYFTGTALLSKKQSLTQPLQA